MRHMGEMGWVGEEKNLECDERVAVAEQRDERRERLVRVELLVRDAHDAIPPEEVVEQRRREALGELPTRVPLGAETLEAELRHVKKPRIKGEIWEKWGATYGRNGCGGRKKTNTCVTLSHQLPWRSFRIPPVREESEKSPRRVREESEKSQRVGSLCI